jgi:hypothetical protein
MELSVNFDIDCLRSFLVIADTMSFSRAAETVGRSQSTISQQIAKLETQVGKPLLTRRKGRVLELTSEGGKLVQYARKILQLNDRLMPRCPMTCSPVLFASVYRSTSSDAISRQGWHASKTGILWSDWRSRLINPKT